jgi:hypothetical protein
MESYAVARAAQRRGIAAAAVRVVGDEADQDLPIVFDGAVRPDGSLAIGTLAARSLAAPQKWAALARFARDQVRSTRALASVLDRLCVALAARRSDSSSSAIG